MTLALFETATAAPPLPNPGIMLFLPAPPLLRAVPSLELLEYGGGRFPRAASQSNGIDAATREGGVPAGIGSLLGV